MKKRIEQILIFALWGFGTLGLAAGAGMDKTDPQPSPKGAEYGVPRSPNSTIQDKIDSLVCHEQTGTYLAHCLGLC
jgi:hypothetical protein